jgi:hypothetical protein
MPMFCINAVLDAVIVCLLGLKVVELLCNPAVQEVRAPCHQSLLAVRRLRQRSDVSPDSR